MTLPTLNNDSSLFSVGRVIHMVEARGVEPLSESVFMGISPGADSHLHSLTQAWADTLKGLVAS